MLNRFKFLYMQFSIFMTIFQQIMMKNPRTQNLTLIGSWWREIQLHEYLISPTEISVNQPGSYFWNQAILHSVGLIRYSCGHISHPNEKISTKFGLWMFFIMLYRYMVCKKLKCKFIYLFLFYFLLIYLFYFCEVITSVLYIASAKDKYSKKCTILV